MKKVSVNNTTDVNELLRIIQTVESNKKYSVLCEYDEDGWINNIIITE